MFFQQKKVFGKHFQVLINLDTTAKSNIGIATLIVNEVNILDTIIGKMVELLE